MDPAVGRLDDRWVAVLAAIGLKDQDRSPVLGVGRDRDVQRGSAGRGVVEDHQKPAILQPHGIRARVRIGNVEQVCRAPGVAEVLGIHRVHLPLLRPSDHPQAAVT